MTRQVCDTLILNGEQHKLLGDEALPENDERIIEVKLEDQDTQVEKECLSVAQATNSTACMRGYISTWEVKDDLLYLNSIKGRYKLLGNVPVVAEWFTDTLKVPTGKKLHHDIVTPLADIYESEIHLKIEKGRMVSSEVIDRREEYESIYGSVKNMSRDEAIEKLRKFAEMDGE